MEIDDRSFNVNDFSWNLCIICVWIMIGDFNEYNRLTSNEYHDQDFTFKFNLQ